MPFEPTPEQDQILDHDSRRHGVILAGPGTGKSATVVAYIERLASEDAPPRIRLLTFTRAATAELAQKVSERPSIVHHRAEQRLAADRTPAAPLSSDTHAIGRRLGADERAASGHTASTDGSGEAPSARRNWDSS